MRILMFGSLQDAAGWRERSLSHLPAGLLALRAELAQENPELGVALERPGVQIALDKLIVRGDAPLEAESEVAFLAPMSGG